MATQVTIYSEDDGHIHGRSVYWGDSANDAGAWQAGSTGEFYVHKDTLSPDQRHRALLRFDLSSIPAGSKITSAVLRLYVSRDNPGGVDMTFNLYKADAKSWDGSGSADFRYYDSPSEWSEYGLEPNQDYTDRIIDSFTKGSSNSAELKELDVTEVAQEALETDTQKLSLMIMKNDGDDAVGGGAENDIVVVGSGDTDATKRPQLLISYQKPISFYEADSAGDIDLNKEVFLSDAGKSRIGSVIQDGTGTIDSPSTGSSKKYFIKNVLSDVDLESVFVFSSPDRVDLWVPDSGNTGNGTISEVTTDSDDTQDEEWEVEFTSATAFTVKRRALNSSDSFVSDTPGTGSTGTAYTSTDRGISFTITAGGTAFASGDKFTGRTWGDDSISGAPSDSDFLVQICKDSGGSPDGKWQYLRFPMSQLNGAVSGSNTLTLDSVDYFTADMKIKIFDVSAKTWSSEYTVQSVSPSTNQITISSSISAADNDWVWGVPIYWSSITAGAAKPFWMRGVCVSTTTKEMKNQYLTAEELFEAWPFEIS